jgi:hypothetical protein
MLANFEPIEFSFELPEVSFDGEVEALGLSGGLGIRGEFLAVFAHGFTGSSRFRM